jgi:hypothetical protein
MAGPQANPLVMLAKGLRMDLTGLLQVLGQVRAGTAADQNIRINPNRIRMTISFAPINYRQGQNPPVRIMVTVNSRTPNTRIVIKLDRLTGTTVPYFRTEQSEDELDQATTPIVTDANGQVTVYIPVDRLPTGFHTFVAGRRTVDGGIDTRSAPLPAMTSDHFRVLAP